MSGESQVLRFIRVLEAVDGGALLVEAEGAEEVGIVAR
jgi:hypothetical protein